MAEIPQSVITEQGDLGLGVNDISQSEKELLKKSLKDNDNKDDKNSSRNGSR